MADIVVTHAKVAVVFPESAEIFNVICAEAITGEGIALYQTTSGTYGIADANDSGKEQFRGIALEQGGTGQCISMLKKGILAGFALATYDDLVYLSDTAGTLGTTAGTMTVRVGRVVSLPDPALTEVLYVEADWLNDWS